MARPDIPKTEVVNFFHASRKIKTQSLNVNKLISIFPLFLFQQRPYFRTTEITITINNSDLRKKQKVKTRNYLFYICGPGETGNR